MLKWIQSINSSLFLLLIIIIGCHQPEEDCNCDDEEATLYTDTINNTKSDTVSISDPIVIQECDLARKLKDAGLVNIQDSIPLLRVELKYSTSDNFMKADVYGCLDSCYLQPDVAVKLKQAFKYLRKKEPNYTLLVYDGVRPRSVQQIMWDTLKMPFAEKVKFVSNPKNGSLHNYGAAVDITIFDNLANEPLDMGTPYDYIGELAWPTKEIALLKSGGISQEIVENRKLLRQVMRQAGFFNIQTEWWHFNSCRREVAKGKYEIVE